MAEILRGGNFCTVFLSAPQESLNVHSFFTREKCFSIAGRNILFESGFSENVEFSKLAG